MNFKELVEQERAKKRANGEIPDPEKNKLKLLELQSALNEGAFSGDFIDRIKAVNRRAAEKKGESVDAMPIPKPSNNGGSNMREELDRDEKMFKEFQNKQNSIISQVKNKSNPYLNEQSSQSLEKVNREDIKKIVYEILEEKLESMVEDLIKDTIVNMHIKEANKNLVIETLRELKKSKK